MLGAFTLKQLRYLCRAIGLDDLFNELRDATPEDVSNRYDEIGEMLQNTLETKTADEWEHILNEAGVPAARVRRIDEALKNTQVTSRNVLQETDYIPETGEPLRVPVAAFNYEHGGPSVTSPSPRLGEHTVEVMSELGYSSADIDDLILSGTVYPS